ncbi:hypothetical protein HMPREF9582_00451 [Cutibacterium acnes HL060PA1]|nr:hypothetical protein HMPREF9582_00451 [Cutibacterium acnes HL060PA1]
MLRRPERSLQVVEASGRYSVASVPPRHGLAVRWCGRWCLPLAHPEFAKL